MLILIFQIFRILWNLPAILVFFSFLRGISGIFYSSIKKKILFEPKKGLDMTNETGKALKASNQDISSDAENLDRKGIARETAEAKASEIKMVTAEKKFNKNSWRNAIISIACFALPAIWASMHF